MSETMRDANDLVRLTPEICEDADEAVGALTKALVDDDGNPTAYGYVDREALERAARVLAWVLEAPPATPPTPDRAAVREALVDVLSWTSSGAMNNLCEALGIDVDTRSVGAIADALLRPAPLPADVQAAVERLRKGVPDGCTERCDDEWCSHALEGVNNAGYNQALDDLLAHLTREAR